MKEKLESGKFIEDNEFKQEQQKLFAMLSGIKNEVEEIRRVGSSGKVGLGEWFEWDFQFDTSIFV